MVLLRVFGFVLLLAAPAMAYAAWDGNQQNIAVFEQMKHTRLRDKTDSANYSSAAYHGSHSMSDEAGRWHPTGYATLGTTGFIVGVAFLVIGFRRRPLTGVAT